VRAEIERRAAAAAKADAARLARWLCKGGSRASDRGAVAKALEDRKALAVKAEPALPRHADAEAQIRASGGRCRRRIGGSSCGASTAKAAIEREAIRPPKPQAGWSGCSAGVAAFEAW